MASFKLIAPLRSRFSADFMKYCNRAPTWCLQRAFHTSFQDFKKRKSQEERKVHHVIQYPVKSKWKTGEVVDIWKEMTVKELASQLGKDVDHVFDVMEYVDNTYRYSKGTNTITDLKVIEEVVKKSGRRFKLVNRPNTEREVERFIDPVRRDSSEYKDVRPRPPVVTVMGHVDHGKTTLLDTLRHTSVAEREFGGITQHIGAFSMVINGKDRVTFLDTPGHAAFCAMRNRGAECTDIVILVVAADDGVMEQTVESVRMAKDAGVPIVVAINKIDKPGADVEAAKKGLLQQGVQVEDAGGEVQVVPISALKGTNFDILMEAILVQAELMQLKTDHSGPVEAVVIESSTDPRRGKLCTLLIQCGTLKKGAVLVAGTAWCRVRAMFDDTGTPLGEAPPSFPVQTTGWRELPSAGEAALEVDTEKRAHEVVGWRTARKLEQKQQEDWTEIETKMEEHRKKYREQLEMKRKMGKFRIRPEGPRKKENLEDDKMTKLNVIIKGDVDGSVEALLDVIETYDDPRCSLDVVHYGVGPVTPNDIVLAQTFSAVIYTFNTHVLKEAKVESEGKKVKIFNHNVIYKLIDDLKRAMSELLPPKEVEEVVGEANVIQEFIINEGKHKVPVAGCRCTKGSLKKSAKFKLLRRGEELYDGSLVSLRHLKDEVETVKKDLECGLRLGDASVRLQAGDTIQCYVIANLPQQIKWDPGF